jgi:hypothetical protein
VRKGFRRDLPTRVARYDLARRIFVAEIDLQAHGLDAIFSILPVPDPIRTAAAQLLMASKDPGK